MKEYLVKVRFEKFGRYAETDFMVRASDASRAEMLVAMMFPDNGQWVEVTAEDVTYDGR